MINTGAESFELKRITLTFEVLLGIEWAPNSCRGNHQRWFDYRVLFLD